MKARLLFEYLISSLSADIRSSDLNVPTFAEETRPEEIWKHKVFCVLSSQFNAQRAAAISANIVKSIPFFEFQPLHQLEDECYKFLSSGGIGYRFPKMKARQLSLCWFPFFQIKDEYQEYVRSFISEDAARHHITETFPGIGYKQASMFLRNIGASKNLSVIDVHVLLYLRVCHEWEGEHLTPRRYRLAENILREDADRYELDLNVFDTIIWSAAKALKKVNAHV
jgi:N-glycosylase/DNA lyase